jgi:hypothetical protein
MPIKSLKQMRKLAELADQGKIKRDVFNKMMDETKNITKLPNRAKKKGK